MYDNISKEAKEFMKKMENFDWEKYLGKVDYVKIPKEDIKSEDALKKIEERSK